MNSFYIHGLKNHRFYFLNSFPKTKTLCKKHQIDRILHALRLYKNINIFVIADEKYNIAVSMNYQISKAKEILDGLKYDLLMNDMSKETKLETKKNENSEMNIDMNDGKLLVFYCSSVFHCVQRLLMMIEAMNVNDDNIHPQYSNTNSDDEKMQRIKEITMNLPINERNREGNYKSVVVDWVLKKCGSIRNIAQSNDVFSRVLDCENDKQNIRLFFNQKQ